MAEAALSDVKIVELGGFVAAPYCTKLMADLGAEVIKIEYLTDRGMASV